MISDPPSAFIVAMDQQEKFGKWARNLRVKPEKTPKVFECRKRNLQQSPILFYLNCVENETGCRYFDKEFENIAVKNIRYTSLHSPFKKRQKEEMSFFIVQ
jgi:hypothetical protein